MNMYYDMISQRAMAFGSTEQIKAISGQQFEQLAAHGKAIAMSLGTKPLYIDNRNKALTEEVEFEKIPA